MFNLEHDEDSKVPAYILEMWLVEEPTKDKSFSTYGIQVPKGTLFAVAQVTDEKYFKDLVDKDQLGFSIEALLNLKYGKFKTQHIMNLPDGKFTAEDGKVYEVKDGVPTLLAEEAEEEKEQEMNQDSETEEDKVEATDEDKSEEETENKAEEESEEEKEEEKEEMSVDPEADAEAIMKVVQPMFDAFKNEVLEILADKLPTEEAETPEGDSEESEEDMSEKKTSLNSHDKLEAVRNYKPEEKK